MGKRSDNAQVRDRILDELADAEIKEYEKMAAEERHRLVNARAAARLLMGAFGAGDITANGYRVALETLGKLEHVNFDLKRHVAIAEGIRPKSSRSKSKHLADFIPSQSRVLVVDDQGESSGWTAFFDAVFGNKVSYALTSAKALDCVQSEGVRLALVVLDLRLPDDPEQGLEVLHGIKKLHLDLPVLIFSSLDEILYARRCMAGGAIDYFVKELGQIERNSIRYYQKFKEVVTASIGNPSWRDIWREIQELPQPPSAAAGSVLFKRVSAHLRRAYYFLTTDENDPRIRLLFSDGSRDGAHVHSHSILECGNALEPMVNDQHDLLARRRAKKAPRRLPAMRLLGAKPKVATFAQKLRDLETDKLLTRSQVTLAREIWASRASAAHGRSQKAEIAISVFQHTLKFAKQFFVDLERLSRE